MSQKNKVAVILGAGITGMTTAWKLSEAGYEVHVIEKTNSLGGMAGSFSYKDMTLDYGPHKIYTQLPGILDVYKEIVQDDLLKIKKKNSIYLLGKYFDFPVKIFQVMLGLGIGTAIKCGFGYGMALLKSFFSKKKPVSYEEYFLQGFGKPSYDLLFRDYALKVWGNPKSLSEELSRKRIPVPNVFALIKSALGMKAEKEISAEYFYYPKKGIGEICDILAEKIKAKNGKIHLNVMAQELIVEQGKVKTVVLNNGTKIACDHVVSTIYITELPSLIKPMPSTAVVDSATSLKFQGMIIVYVIVNKSTVMKDNWIFFPEKRYVFNRIAEHKSFSSFIVPEHKTVLTAEITCKPGDALWEEPAEKVYEKVISDLEKVGILKKEDVLECISRRMKRVYPIYTIGFKGHLQVILDYLSTIPNLITLGRQGLFNYNNTDHCIDMALKASEHILHEGSPEEWNKTIAYFDAYRIVD